RHALDEGMRVVTQDVAVVAGAGLALVGVAHHVFLAGGVARHEAPLHAGRKARAAAAAQTRGLHFLDDLLGRDLLAQDALPGLVPVDLAVAGKLPRALEPEFRPQRLEAHQVLRILLSPRSEE